jgi:hypothetical protein
MAYPELYLDHADLVALAYAKSSMVLVQHHSDIVASGVTLSGRNYRKDVVVD